MRKIIVISMISLDGVMQAPGGPEEDTSGGFRYGGWVAPFVEGDSSETMQKLMEPSDLLLGRKTFDIWEPYWPKHAEVWPGINEVTKYVFSRSRNHSEWEHSVFLSDVEAIKELKKTKGSDLKVWGSSELIRLLLENDLVDELWLKIYPVTLGQGKKLFSEGAIAATFEVVHSEATPMGIIIANYKRGGPVRTGQISA